MFSKNWHCRFLLYCFQSLISRWQERRYCTCNVCITNTQILFTRRSVWVSKLGQTDQQRHKKHLGTSGAMPQETFWDIEYLKYHFLHFGGSFDTITKCHIYNTQLGENWRGWVLPPVPCGTAAAIHHYFTKFYILSHKHYLL